MQEKEITLNQVASMIEDNGKNIISQMKVLVEGVGKDIRMVAEGHMVIRSEIKQMKEELVQKIDFVDSKVNFLGGEVKEIKKDLQEVKEDLKEVKGKVDKIDWTLEEHAKLPAHAGV